jgi:precorrin-6B methylase 2
MNKILVINSMLWSFILWHYYIKQCLIKQKLRRSLQGSPEFKTIKKMEGVVKQLYNNSEAYVLSRKACKKLGVKGNDFVYGEIEFLSFCAILQRVNPKQSDVFYDLGCGSGKAVLTAALCFKFSKAVGVELLPELYHLANKQLKKVRDLGADIKQLDCVQFLNNDYLNCNFSEATILFINATCINEQNWNDLLKKIAKLPIGSRVVITSKQIQDVQFKLLSASKEQMSWGQATVTSYLKTS